jgi:hypothetical protein
MLALPVGSMIGGDDRREGAMAELPSIELYSDIH